MNIDAGKRGADDAGSVSNAEITEDTLMAAIIDDDPRIFFRLGQVSSELDGLTDPMTIGMLRHVTVGELARVVRMGTGELISALTALMSDTDKED